MWGTVVPLALYLSDVLHVQCSLGQWDLQWIEPPFHTYSACHCSSSSRASSTICLMEYGVHVAPLFAIQNGSGSQASFRGQEHLDLSWGRLASHAYATDGSAALSCLRSLHITNWVCPSLQSAFSLGSIFVKLGNLIGLPSIWHLPTPFRLC